MTPHFLISLILSYHSHYFYQRLLQIKKQCQDALSSLAWVTDVDVSILKRSPFNATAAMGSSLQHVEHIIAISSCKVTYTYSTYLHDLTKCSYMYAIQSYLMKYVTPHVRTSSCDVMLCCVVLCCVVLCCVVLCCVVLCCVVLCCVVLCCVVLCCVVM